MNAVEAISLNHLVAVDSLVGNRERVNASDTLEVVRQRFEQHPHEFMAVLDEGVFVGLCGRRQLGMVLGSRFGHSVYGRRCIDQTNALTPAVTINIGTPIDKVLTPAFSRDEQELFDDIALLSVEGEFLGLIFASTLVRIQTQMLLQKIKQMQDDLVLARDVQQALLPIRFPISDSLSFYHQYLPVETVSGDFFHAHQIDEHKMGVFICDVMGHGVRSAFVTALLRALVEDISSRGKNPSELLEYVNRELIAILPMDEVLLFATAVYLLIDLESQEVLFANAGHPDPLRFSSVSGSAEFLRDGDDSIGSALGLLPDSVYPIQRASLSPGDQLLLYTDGILEILNSRGEELSKSELANILVEENPIGPRELVNCVLSRARAHAFDGAFTDDVCLVALQYQ